MLARFSRALYARERVHASDLADIPRRKVLIEVVSIPEHVLHIDDLQVSCSKTQ